MRGRGAQRAAASLRLFLGGHEAGDEGKCVLVILDAELDLAAFKDFAGRVRMVAGDGQLLPVEADDAHDRLLLAPRRRGLAIEGAALLLADRERPFVLRLSEDWSRRFRARLADRAQYDGGVGVAGTFHVPTRSGGSAANAVDVAKRTAPRVANPLMTFMTFPPQEMVSHRSFATVWPQRSMMFGV